MLLDFTVKNFMSFRDETTFSMEVGERLRKFKKENTISRDKTRLIKSALIFGANGAGKSNLFIAIKKLQQLVLKSTQTVDDELPYVPFQLNNETKDNNTKFNIRFFVENTLYSYTVIYNKDSFVYEKLSLKYKNREKTYFLRNMEKGIEKIPASVTTNKRKIRKNKTVLYTGQENNDKVCSTVYKWFSSSLVFFGNNNIKELYKLLEDEETKNVFLQLLKFADFNIVDFDKKTIDLSDKIPEHTLKMMSEITEQTGRKFDATLDILFTFYKQYDDDGNVIGEVPIDIDSDSSGTRKMIDLILTMLASRKKDVTLFVDEFDDSFHLSLAKSIIRIINSEGNHNQFVLTTHNANLLDENLRKDQIYFIVKNFKGISSLYSLFDFNELKSKTRNDITYFKRYVRGQFGGVPYIDIDQMVNVLKDEYNG